MVRGAADHTELADPSAFAGVGPFAFRGRRVNAALTDQTDLRSGFGGILIGAALRESCHKNQVM